MQIKWPNCQNNTSSLNKYWLKNKNRVDNDKVSPILNLWMSSMLNVSVSCCELKPRHRVYRSLLVWLSDRPLHCSVPMEDNHRQSRVTMNSFLHSSISRRALQTHLFSQHKRSHLLWCHCQRLSFVSVAFRNSTPSLSLVLRLNCKKRGEVRSACFWIVRKRFSHEKCTCVVWRGPVYSAERQSNKYFTFNVIVWGLREHLCLERRTVQQEIFIFEPIKPSANYPQCVLGGGGGGGGLRLLWWIFPVFWR